MEALKFKIQILNLCYIWKTVTFRVRVHARISVLVGPGPVSSAGLPAQGTAAQVQTAQVPSARLLALVMAARCRRRWLWLRWDSHGPGAGGPDAGAEPAWELLEHAFFYFCLKQKLIWDTTWSVSLRSPFVPNASTAVVVWWQVTACSVTLATLLAV